MMTLRTHRAARTRMWPGPLVTVCLAMGLAVSSACVQPPLRGTIGPAEQERFRTAAMAYLVETSMRANPTLRMNAIEALAEAAPQQGLDVITFNLEDEHPRVSFAALMALGSIGNADAIERIRTRAEHADPSVRIAALYALHRLGDRRRTGELSGYLLDHPDARVRANAALVFGRLREPSSIPLLRRALAHEEKDLPKLQVLEALAILGDTHATERLIADGYSAYPDQAAIGLMFLANARANSRKTKDLYFYRLQSAEYPEVRLQAARALGLLGVGDGLDLAVAHLWFNSPKSGRPNDPPAQQISRVRGLAALALEAIRSPESLKSLMAAFELDGQAPYVRVAIARAAVRIINPKRRRPQARRPEVIAVPARGEARRQR